MKRAIYFTEVFGMATGLFFAYALFSGAWKGELLVSNDLVSNYIFYSAMLYVSINGICYCAYLILYTSKNNFEDIASNKYLIILLSLPTAGIVAPLLEWKIYDLEFTKRSDKQMLAQAFSIGGIVSGIASIAFNLILLSKSIYLEKIDSSSAQFGILALAVVLPIFGIFWGIANSVLFWNNSFTRKYDDANAVKWIKGAFQLFNRIAASLLVVFIVWRMIWNYLALIYDFIKKLALFGNGAPTYVFLQAIVLLIKILALVFILILAIKCLIRVWSLQEKNEINQIEDYANNQSEITEYTFY